MGDIVNIIFGTVGWFADGDASVGMRLVVGAIDTLFVGNMDDDIGFVDGMTDGEMAGLEASLEGKRNVVDNSRRSLVGALVGAFDVVCCSLRRQSNKNSEYLD